MSRTDVSIETFGLFCDLLTVDMYCWMESSKNDEEDLHRVPKELALGGGASSSWHSRQHPSARTTMQSTFSLAHSVCMFFLISLSENLSLSESNFCMWVSNVPSFTLFTKASHEPTSP